MGRVLAVSSPGEDGSGGALPDSGAAFVFAIDPSTRLVTPVAPAYLKASNAGSGDAFGTSLALTDELLVVGAPFEDPADMANWDWDGGGADGSGGPDTGASYSFR